VRMKAVNHEPMISLEGIAFHLGLWGCQCNQIFDW